MKLTNRGKCIQYKAFAFLIYLIPMTLLFFINLGAYTNNSGSVNFWGIVLFVGIVLAFKNYIIDVFKKRTLLAVNIALLLMAIIMRYLSDEVILITAVGGVSALIATFVEIVADTYDLMSYRLVDGVKIKNTAPALSDKEAWQQAYGIAAEE